MDMLGQEGPTQNARRQTVEQVGIDKNLLKRVCRAGWELSVPAPPAHRFFTDQVYTNGLSSAFPLVPTVTLSHTAS